MGMRSEANQGSLTDASGFPPRRSGLLSGVKEEGSAVVPATGRLLFPRARGSNTPSSRWGGDVGWPSRAGINGAAVREYALHRDLSCGRRPIYA